MTNASLDRPIPDFTVDSTDGKLSAADLRGQPTALYFYPKDNTPGCTQEGEEFRDLHSEFAKLGVHLFGISRDSLASHEAFRAKHALPFHLISDSDELLCRLFDVIREKNLYGKKVLGIERSTFLVDADGVLRREWRKVKAAGHAAEVLTAARELQLP